MIKNFGKLAKTPERKTVLELIEAAFAAIAPDKVLSENFSLNGSNLKLKNEGVDLTKFERIFLIGFGKGSAGISKIVEGALGDKLTAGYDIDVVEEKFSKIQFVLGTHPLPSQTNLDFTKTVLDNIHDLTPKDLVLVVICGGGSALFEHPYAASFEDVNKINKELINSGATISEINIVRKHLSQTKGGGLAKHLYPAVVRSLIFSDVPGNDVSVIASGPTALNNTTLEDANNVLKKYNLDQNISQFFTETPKEPKYFESVKNIFMVSNLTALDAMEKRARELNVKTRVLSDRVQGDAKELGQKLIDEATSGEVLLAGGESTIHVTGNGHGGRNQTLVTAALEYVGDSTTIASFDSDGVDFYGFAGAIGDKLSLAVAQQKGLDPKEYLRNDDTYTFLEAIGDGIDTGKLKSNVSDLMIVLKR